MTTIHLTLWRKIGVAFICAPYVLGRHLSAQQQLRNHVPRNLLNGEAHLSSKLLASPKVDITVVFGTAQPAGKEA